VWRALFRRRYPLLYNKIINHTQAGDLNWKSHFENRFKLGNLSLLFFSVSRISFLFQILYFHAKLEDVRFGILMNIFIFE